MILEIAVASLITQVATKGIEQVFASSVDKVTSDSIEWFKSLFYKDGKPKKIMEELERDPTNEQKISNAKSIIQNSLEDNPEFEHYLKELLDKLPKVENNVSGSKNVITGNINTGGGNFINGDRNQIS